MEPEHDPNKIPFELTDTDRENLAGGDENFQPHNWEDLKHIIGSTYPLIVLINSSLSFLSSEQQSLRPQTQTL